MDDYDFLYSLHKSTMRVYINPLWGWHDAWQEEYFQKKFDPDRRQIIQVNSQDAGVLVVEERPGELYLGLIELLPKYQNQGIGSAIVSRLIDRANSNLLPLSLHVLKTNKPARRFYERLGLVVVEEEERRFKMEYNPLRRQGNL
ncbi:MAG: GNAT family N-acetyltransferase [Chloroflexota bacterium]